VIRDVDVSWDGSTILFSWKKSDRQRRLQPVHDGRRRHARSRRITERSGPRRLRGRLSCRTAISSSTPRAVCRSWTAGGPRCRISTCARPRRPNSCAGSRFDQVHDQLSDGDWRTVVSLYTRWDYNDRGQLFPQGLFQMNPGRDGAAWSTTATASWFPTTIAARPGHSRFSEGAGGLHRPSFVSRRASLA
jgi:hypothetical protein